jgi:hypothetical protein
MVRSAVEMTGSAHMRLPPDVLACAGTLIHRDTVVAPRCGAATQAEIDTEAF